MGGGAAHIIRPLPCDAAPPLLGRLLLCLCGSRTPFGRHLICAPSRRRGVPCDPLRDIGGFPCGGFPSLCRLGSVGLLLSLRVQVQSGARCAFWRGQKATFGQGRWQAGAVLPQECPWYRLCTSRALRFSSSMRFCSASATSFLAERAQKSREEL